MSDRDYTDFLKLAFSELRKVVCGPPALDRGKAPHESCPGHPQTGVMVIARQRAGHAIKRRTWPRASFPPPSLGPGSLLRHLSKDPNRLHGPGPNAPQPRSNNHRLRVREPGYERSLGGGLVHSPPSDGCHPPPPGVSACVWRVRTHGVPLSGRGTKTVLAGITYLTLPQAFASPAGYLR